MAVSLVVLSFVSFFTGFLFLEAFNGAFEEKKENGFTAKFYGWIACGIASLFACAMFAGLATNVLGKM